jgi:hypothetical protein
VHSRNAQAVEALNTVLGTGADHGSANQKVAKVWDQRVVAAVMWALTCGFVGPVGLEPTTRGLKGAMMP